MSLALLRDAWRSLHGRSGPTIAAVGGLSLALAASLIVAMIANALASPDPSIPDPDRVVLLDFKGNLPGQPSPWFTGAPLAFGPMLKERRAPLDLISRVGNDGMDIRIDGRTESALLQIADPDIVPLLGLRSLSGDLRRTLSSRDSIAITTDLLRKLWGELPPDQAIGRRIESRGRMYTVTAVIPNTDPRSPLWTDTLPAVGRAMVMVGFVALGDHEAFQEIYAVHGRVYARLREGMTTQPIGTWMRDAFMASPRYAQLPAEWKAGREAAYFRGITLTQLPFEGEANELRWRLLVAIASATALLLVMAAFNCTNLQTATLLQRQRETALRRSLGADAYDLLLLWGTEVLLSLLLAASGALLLAWWVAPTVGHWLGLQSEHRIGDSIPGVVLLGLIAAALVILVSTLALPAAGALRQAPAPALQGRTASEGPSGRRVRQGLLAIQLSGVVLLLSLAGVLGTQQRHLLSADRGFATHNRLWLGVMTDPNALPNLDAFVAALSSHPAVLHWSFSDSPPARSTRGWLDLNVSASQHKQVLRMSRVSPSFFATYGMTILAGQPLVGAGDTTVVIDAKAARALGFAMPQQAIGQIVRGGGPFLQEGKDERRIVAVVKDVKLESARNPALPQGFILTDKPQWDISIYGRDLDSLRQTVEELWKAHGPASRYELQSADDQRAAIYSQEQRMTTMLTAVAVLSVGVAMLGAYTLVADALRRRRTEIVLRRLHGAGHAAIVRELAIEFAPPLIIAMLLGLPLALWLGERYLDGFVDRVATSTGLVMPMLIAAIATLFITAMATLQHVRRALRLQPIEALR
jgi:ABC-type lipoprotein release transport system permease subunit